METQESSISSLQIPHLHFSLGHRLLHLTIKLLDTRGLTPRQMSNETSDRSVLWSNRLATHKNVHDCSRSNRYALKVVNPFIPSQVSQSNGLNLYHASNANQALDLKHREFTFGKTLNTLWRKYWEYPLCNC